MTLPAGLRLFIAFALMTGLSACGWKFPEAPWMDKDPLSFITTNRAETGRVPDVRPDGRMGSEDHKNTTPQQAEIILASKPDEQIVDINTYLDPTLPPEDRLTRLEKVVKRLYARDMETPKHAGIPPVKAMPLEAAGNPVSLVPPAQDMEPVLRGPRPFQSPNTTVTGIRVGTHPGYVRLVFDVTGPTPFSVDLDNTEKILVVELNGTAWQPPTMSESFGRMDLLKSYKVDKMGDQTGHIFVMQLKRATMVMQSKVYPALSGGGKRIVIDLKR